jgi:hypothetical protein
VLSQPEHRLTAQAEVVLASLLDAERPHQPNTDYGLDLHQTALVQLAMVRELAKAPEDLEQAIVRLLTPKRAAA